MEMTMTSKLLVTVRGIRPDSRGGMLPVYCKERWEPAKKGVVKENKAEAVIQKQLAPKQEIQMPKPLSSRLPVILEGETTVTAKKATSAAAKEKIIRQPGSSSLTRTVSGFFDKEKIRWLTERALGNNSFNSEEGENIPPKEQAVSSPKKQGRTISQPLAESTEHPILQEKRKLETVSDEVLAKFSTQDFFLLRESLYLSRENTGPEPLGPIWFKEFWEEPENIG
jgi:hypothetical protein